MGGWNNPQRTRAIEIVIVDLLEATDDESLQIDGSMPHDFGEWRLKRVKTAWFTKVAPIDKQAAVVWPTLWKTNVLSITHKFVYKVLLKKLQVRQRMGLVKEVPDGCVWCGAQDTVYHFVNSYPLVRVLYAACRDVAIPVVQGINFGRWVVGDSIIALTNPTGLFVWGGGGGYIDSGR